MQCAFCSATLPATTVGVLDYLSETCTSGCDGEGRFDVRCPACSRIVASYDLPLGYDARNLAEKLGKPLYQAGISEEWPGTVDNPASSIGDMDFLVEYEGQVVTATVLRHNPRGHGHVYGPHPVARREVFQPIVAAYMAVDDLEASLAERFARHDSTATDELGRARVAVYRLVLEAQPKEE